MNSLFCRIYQGAMKVGMYMLPWHTPEVIEDRADSDRLLEDIKRREVERLLVVMGPNMMKRGLPVPMLEKLRANGIECEVFDRLTSDPTDAQVEEGVRLYNEKNAQGIILFGGGSPMDCGKAIAARIAGQDDRGASGRAQGAFEEKSACDVGDTNDFGNRLRGDDGSSDNGS